MIPTPVEVVPGAMQGDAPLVTVTSKTFLPEGRGVIFPEIEQPALLPEKLPLLPMITEAEVPSRPPKVQLPTTSDRFAAAL